MNVSSSEAPALLNTTLQRLAAQSAACKLWSIVLTSAVLVMTAERGGDGELLWAAAPALLLGLADAAYKVQAGRIAAWGANAKETVRVEDLFRMQTGNSGFAASLQSLTGLISFSVWPFYVALTTLVIVLGQTALHPRGNSQFLPQKPSINGSPYQPNTMRPDFSNQHGPSASSPGTGAYSSNSKMPRPTGFTPPKGGPSFQPPPNQNTLSRPTFPPKGAPTAKPNFPGTVTNSPAGPSSPPPPSANFNRPATNTFPPQPPKISSTQAQQPK
jgi:hypothetical protein